MLINLKNQVSLARRLGMNTPMPGDSDNKVSPSHNISGTNVKLVTTVAEDSLPMTHLRIKMNSNHGQDICPAIPPNLCEYMFHTLHRM